MRGTVFLLSGGRGLVRCGKIPETVLNFGKILKKFRIKFDFGWKKFWTHFLGRPTYGTPCAQYVPYVRANCVAFVHHFSFHGFGLSFVVFLGAELKIIVVYLHVSACSNTDNVYNYVCVQNERGRKNGGRE